MSYTEFFDAAGKLTVSLATKCLTCHRVPNHKRRQHPTGAQYRRMATSHIRPSFHWCCRIQWVAFDMVYRWNYITSMLCILKNLLLLVLRTKNPFEYAFVSIPMLGALSQHKCTAERNSIETVMLRICHEREIRIFFANLLNTMRIHYMLIV